ncbi:MAG: nicotinate-nucleotide--dimethylbenzimidazole phosphoribosyltransferase, partial [Mesorhizobium sp.]
MQALRDAPSTGASRHCRAVVPGGEGGYAAGCSCKETAFDMTAKPFDDFRTLLATLPPADAAAETRVRT